VEFHLLGADCHRDSQSSPTRPCLWLHSERSARLSRYHKLQPFHTMQSRGGAQKAKDELNNILLHGQELKLGWGKAVVTPAVPLYSASGAPAAKGEQSRAGMHGDMHGCVGSWDLPKKVGRVHACHAADWAADHSMALLGYGGGGGAPRRRAAQQRGPACNLPQPKLATVAK